MTVLHAVPFWGALKDATVSEEWRCNDERTDKKSTLERFKSRPTPNPADVTTLQDAISWMSEMMR